MRVEKRGVQAGRQRTKPFCEMAGNWKYTRKRRGRSMQGLLKGCYSERVRERAVITKAEGFFIGEKARGGSVDSGFDALRFRSRCTFLCLSLSVCVC